MRNWQNTRDIILFFGGLAGVFNETFLSHAERPTLLILFAAMMGLPAFLRTDDKNQSSPLPPDQIRQELERKARSRQDEYEHRLEQRARERIEERRRQHGKGTE